MDKYTFLFEIGLILVSTKILSIIAKRLGFPQVVGSLIAGLVLGPALLGLISSNIFLDQVSEIGVIVLMFVAGLETDISELKKTGKASFVIALLGVIVPLVGGYILASFFNVETGDHVFLQNLFIGVILTATSVSITVETLKEMGKLSTKSGNAILGAALIDDILGIVALTVVSGAADSSVNLSVVLMKIVMFFVISGGLGFIVVKFLGSWLDRFDKDNITVTIVAFACCLFFSFVSEHFFGVADITGAFVVGLILSNTKCSHYVTTRCEGISALLLSPVFFTNIGLKMVIPQMSNSLILFAILLIILAVVSKIIGCGLGAKMCGFSNKDSLCVGVGMISRGEVALIIASKGVALGLMNESFYAPIILMVVVTTVITPILLKIVYRNSNNDSKRVQFS
ncbi:MAG: cation:proton antiporter [Oscillospiraceae bacterium]